MTFEEMIANADCYNNSDDYKDYETKFMCGNYYLTMTYVTDGQFYFCFNHESGADTRDVIEFDFSGTWNPKTSWIPKLPEIRRAVITKMLRISEWD
jgi:hypothetical protein